MCELLGLSSKDRANTAGLLTEFFSHAAENPHGWGAAVFDGGKARTVKEPVSAEESTEAKKIAEDGLQTDLLIAHIRYATKGAVSIENTHPFYMSDISGREWVLAHNGTIFESEELSAFVHDQQGETDSERILLYLVERLNAWIRGRFARHDDPSKTSSAARTVGAADLFDAPTEVSGNNGTPASASDIFGVVEGVIREITPKNKVNLLISDGRFLYVHTNYRGSLFYIQKDGAAAVSTRPLREALPGDWEEVPMNTLMVFEKGSEIYRSKAHGNEYFEDEERIRELFLDYALM